MAGGVKPVPPVVSAPQDGSKHPIGNVEIRGTCSLGATAVDVLNWDNSKLADATVNGTIWTYNRVWDAGTKHVKARQWVNGTPSDPGNQHEFVVGAFAKPPKPLILSPEQGDKYPVGPLMVIGSCLSGATVEVLNWDNSKLGDATVTGTIWTYSRVWDAGTKHVKARQWVNGTPSDPGNQHEFVVGAFAKPPKPLILSPEQGDKYPVGPLMVIGSCLSGATVEVLNWDNSKLGDATVTGTIWTYSRVWDAGTKHVKARQWVNGTPSDPGNQHEFVVGAFAKPPKPLILSPEQGDKYPVGPLMVIGSCLSGATVEVLNWDNSKLGDATVTGTIWTYSRVWDAGTKHVKARQWVNGTPSDPGNQHEFVVGAFAKPPKPLILSPEQGDKYPVGPLMVIGSCLSGATVEVLNWDNSKLGDATVTGTIWTYSRVWDAGTKHVKARQWVNGTPSDPGNQHEFVVGAFEKLDKVAVIVNAVRRDCQFLQVVLLLGCQ
ncbi:hypothetical protein PS723_03763 [Pseudomonas fluorescens]|uniref:Uncharacterized protein n=2 Tax=Pseudomonas fluorescens TaxID=294 RepID=A0A5E7DPH4_PSEFL|nr:hypothetical protein PS723_03763 [Pseudomonas fluorescens]